jgi:hypothetical protein
MSTVEINMNENFIFELIKLLILVISGAIGWVVAHHFTAKRDIKNSQRSIRIEALTEAYKILVRSGIESSIVKWDQHGKVNDLPTKIEDAIALIHLYGTSLQSKLADEYTIQMSTKNHADSTKLVNEIRRDIREGLGGNDLETTPHYLKITVHHNPPIISQNNSHP